MRPIILFCPLLLLCFFSTAQKLPVAEWVTRLKDDSKQQVIKHYSVYQDIAKLDSASKIKAAIEIEKECAKGNRRLRLVGRSVKAKLLFYNIDEGDSLHASEMKACLNEAVQMDEPFLQAEFGRWYSEMLNSLNQKELAVQYAISSLKLHEYLGLEYFPSVGLFYLWLGEALMLTDYLNDAIGYLHRGLALSKSDTLVRKHNIMFTYNNLGIIYRRKNQHDSALYYFNQVKLVSTAINRPDWTEIATSNSMMSFVELGRLDTATVVAEDLLQKSRQQNNQADEMYAAEILGYIAFAKKDYTNALQHLFYSKQLNGNKNQRALSRVNEKIAACYETLGQPQNAYPYLKAFRQYKDSVSKTKENYNSRYLFVKGEYEKEQMELKRLSAEIKQSIRYRNIGIGMVLLFAILGMWWLNRRRKKAEQQQQQAGKELELFKDEILKKNSRIEELLASIEQQQHKQQDAQSREELSRQMILTEADWQNFKTLFEKTHPSFFKLLRTKAPGITEAEQRMAALLKIQLNTKQIAAMQGIGTDSVHKTRHRLRQRFGTGTTAELETLITAI